MDINISEARAVVSRHDQNQWSRSAIATACVPANPAWLSLSSAQSVLLLQGPVGPFFDRLARWLHASGAVVNRVVFQGGDEFDCRALTPLRFTAPLSQWQLFLESTLSQFKVDHVVLFGQSRAYHAVARQVCTQLGVALVVMEEGYFRPGFGTMELDGVNGYSVTLDKYHWDPAAAHAIHDRSSVIHPVFQRDIQPHVSPSHFQKMAWHASQHYIAMDKSRANYPNYQHHKLDNPSWYARYWVWSWVKKFWYLCADRPLQARLLAGSQPYFFVPLQHDGDAQITHHSCFSQNTDFIIQVMRSFCRYAPSDSALVFRQHPYSRGGVGHSRLIHTLARELNIGSRVLHLSEADTPLLAQHSAGVVLINSTVGLQALERGAPLMVMGDALYNQPPLSFWGGLDLFWQNAAKPDPETTRVFLGQMKNLTQVPTSLYALRDEPLAWE